jgi:ABC-2 type transport system permease protein
VGGSAYLALAVVSVVPVFVGVGAVASQLAPTKRMATGLATGVLVIDFALRTVSAVSSAGLDWLRWTTPLGWVEALRPFADPQPLVLLLPTLTAVLLLVVAGSLAVRRDIGSGLLPARDTKPPQLRLLGSPAAQALRSERGALLAWLAGVGAFAFLMGVISDAATPDVISENIQRQLEKLGTQSVVTPTGWLGFAFIFFILAVSVYCSMQIASIRGEEAEQRLETLLVLPVGRYGWLGGRLLAGAAGAAALAFAAGALAWAGAAAEGADVSLPRLLEASANTLPPALLFLALGALAFALAPRASAVIAYGLVGLAFVWELFGSLLEVPNWLLALSPFHDVGLVPGEPFEAGAAAVMIALAALVSVAALWAFRRRDLVGA